MMLPQQSSLPARRAFTTMEITISLALLVACAVSIGRFSYGIHRGLQAQERYDRMGWETRNLRERIAAWPLEKITKSNIESEPIPPSLAAIVPAAHWVAQVRSVDEPTPALRVELELHGKLQGQAAAPIALTFWVIDDSAVAGDPAAALEVPTDAP